MQVIYTENDKILLREINELKNLEMCYLLIGRLNIANIWIILKLIYRFSTVSITIPDVSLCFVFLTNWQDGYKNLEGNAKGLDSNL